MPQGQRANHVARQRKRAKKPKRWLSKELLKAWQRAINISPRDIAAYTPSHADVLIAEAFVQGKTAVQEIADHTKLNREQVRNIMFTPLSMAWISDQTERLMRTHKGVIDAALHARAAGGDTTAMRLWYERHDVMNRQPQTQINIGQINYDALSNDDLTTILTGKLLSPEGKIIDVNPGGADRGPGGAEGPGGPDEGGAAPVLPQDAGEAQEAADLLLSPEEREAEGGFLRGEPEREDDSGRTPGGC